MKISAKKKLFLLLSPFILVAYLEFWAHSSPRADPETQVEVKLAEGQSLSSFSYELAKANLVSSAYLFQIYVRLRSNYRKFQAGNYQFSLDSSPSQVISKVLSGEIFTPVLMKFTVPEGAKMEDIFASLEPLGYSKEALYKLARDPKLLQKLGVKAASLEGYLFPSTYSFYHNKPSAQEVLQKMVEHFFASLDEDYKAKLKEQKLTLHKAVIIASLIEKETSLEKEKPLVAEVIKNRLNDQIKLGVDASVIYGIDHFNGNLTAKHLRDKKNKYNTRVHYGLPPGPIASPSLSSLKALLNPSNEGYYYYVLKPGPGQKEHFFSKNLNEHRVYVRKLRESRK